MNWKTIKTVLWSAIAGALVWWIVLGAALGWMSSGSAEKQATKRVQTAVRDALTPICVERFNHDADKDQKLKALKQESAWQRDDFVAKQGWATLSSDGHADLGVAQECANRILAANHS